MLQLKSGHRLNPYFLSWYVTLTVAKANPNYSIKINVTPNIKIASGVTVTELCVSVRVSHVLELG